MTNHGIIPGPTPTDWIGGTIPWENRNPSANWYSNLVIGEHQSFNGVDVMACVSFAGDNVCEIQVKDQTGMEFNFSDRFLAKVSGTTPQGNRVSTVLDSLKKMGNVGEPVWPVPPAPVTWNNYYSPIPQSVINQATPWNIKYELQYEYVPDMSPANVRKQLQHAPLMITIPGHEITAISLSDDGTTLTVLDDYVFNVDPNQPFVRTLKLKDVTDIFKAVLTVKNMSNTRFVHKVGTGEYAFYVPATSPESLKDKALNYGIDVTKPDGTVDFTKAEEVEFK